MARCRDKKHPRYPFYGGRGIVVDKNWEEFKYFKEDMHQSYLVHSESHKYTTLDRVNNNGNYCKENCRWATQKEQANNRGNNLLYEYAGKKDTLSSWATFFGVKRSLLYPKLSIDKDFKETVFNALYL